jgi:hypothetical protein
MNILRVISYEVLAAVASLERASVN